MNTIELTEMADYLQRLRTSLRSITLAEREDIVQEIEMHIRERMAEGSQTSAQVLKQLGPADELALQYSTGTLLKRASASFSPLLLLRATFRWAMTGLQGFAVFMIALLGYCLGLGFLAVGILKPIDPAHVGLWVGPDLFDFGARYPAPSGAIHEVLGWWMIPVAAFLAAFFLTFTTRLTRSLIRRFGWKWPGFGAAGTLKLGVV